MDVGMSLVWTLWCYLSLGQDIELVSQVLKVEDYNVESAIFAIFQVQEVERISKYVDFVT